MTLPLFISLSGLVLCLLFFIYCRSYLKRRTGQERILAEFREEVNEILAEIDEKTDRDALLVEERIKRLKTVLEDTDKRIALYVRELERRGNQERAYAELGKNRLRGLENLSPPPPPVPCSPAEPAADPAGEQAEGDEGRENAGPRFTKAPREIPPRPRPLAEQVAELARAGFSPKMIASRLELSISEVELAIAIAERKSPG